MTQQDKIILAMLTNRDKVWWFPADFNQLGSHHFVGYEATARLSEVAQKYPDMIRSEKDGKFIKRSIRWENMSLWIDQLPATIKVTKKERVQQ